MVSLSISYRHETVLIIHTQCALNNDAISNIKPGSVTYVKSFDIENGLNVIDLSKILYSFLNRFQQRGCRT